MDPKPSTPSGTHQRLKLQSSYPALQTLLPKLASLSPSKVKGPTFRQREEAEFFIRNISNKSDNKILIPIWIIDHNDLRNSKILSWSITRHCC